MKIVSSAQMRELDAKAIETLKIPGDTLMDRAGMGVSNAIRRLIDEKNYSSPFVLLVAGRGYNGGDAFVAARYLEEDEIDCEVWIAGTAAEIRGDALTHLGRMKSAHVPFRELPTRKDWDDALADLPITPSIGISVVADGILGTGLEGPARGPAAGAIRYVNALSKSAQVVAIDVPSGLNSDTGLAEGDAVRADITAAIGLPKLGLIQPGAANHVGRLEVVDIGIPAELLEKADSEMELITPQDLSPCLKRRPCDSHKGAYGHLLILGGAAGYSGAAQMAARAALRSGVGLVTVVTPASLASSLAGNVMEAMVYAAPETETGSLSRDTWPVWRSRLGEFSALLAGPGMTCHADTEALVRAILHDASIPVVLDADALNVLAGKPDTLASAAGPLVITPHPGELGRLLGCSAADIQADRFRAVRSGADATQAVTVLKGFGTLVTQPGAPLHINMTGNPGMAKGGSGDVLAGLLGGLLAQGIPPFDAARMAVYLHGRAGDMSATHLTQAGVTAGDLIASLPFVFRELTPR